MCRAARGSDERPNRNGGDDTAAAVHSTASPPPSRRPRNADGPPSISGRRVRRRRRHRRQEEPTKRGTQEGRATGLADGSESAVAVHTTASPPHLVGPALPAAPPSNARQCERRRHRRKGADEPRDAGEREAIALARRGRDGEDGGGAPNSTTAAPRRPCTAGEPPLHRKTSGASTASSRRSRRAAGRGGAGSDRASCPRGPVRG